MNGQSQQSTVQEQPASDGQQMQVKVISPSAAREEKTTPLSAVFVAHGMGQHLKYETLDLLSKRLIKTDSVVRGETDTSVSPEPDVITIMCSGGYLHGVKLRLKGENVEHEVHIFEGYWAPLTEGEVSLRDVMTFLVTAGLNGLANAGRQFRRFLFNRLNPFPSNLRTTIYLLTAMLVIAGLAIMNMAIVTVAALSSPLVTYSPDWLNGLRPDLTTLFNLFLLVAAAFGFAIYRSRMRNSTGNVESEESPAQSSKLTKISVVLFIVTLGLTIACGLAIPLLFYGHVSGGPQTGYLKTAFGASLVSIVNCVFSLLLLLLLVVLLWKALGKIKWDQIKASLKKIRTERPSKLLFWGAMAGLAIILVLNIRLLVTILPDLFDDRFTSTALSSFWERLWATLESVCNSLSGLSWPLLIAVSWYVRELLVQYVGDVAVYVASHKLDRFNNLRDKIRETIRTAAEAVYEAPAANGDGFAYDSVFIVGHSLGSVIVYDTLNRLINENELRKRKLNEDELRGRKLNEDELRERKLDVVGRTKLLLTFGSPLDKLAFLFAQQQEGTGTPIREALIAAAQPLVQSAEFRQFEWINIHSDLDIISGALNFYDPVEGQGSGTGLPDTESLKPKPVRNLIDEEARTLLAAHVEYWENPLLFKILHEKLIEKA